MFHPSPVNLESDDPLGKGLVSRIDEKTDSDRKGVVGVENPTSRPKHLVVNLLKR